MDIGNPQDWQQGTGAIKMGIDTLRSLWALTKDIRGSDRKDADEVVEKAFEEAETSAKIAEAEIAKALGYELCRCAFPPTAMLTVGHFTRGVKIGEYKPVYECPKCGKDTAGPFIYERTTPKRAADK
jgi:hypothetical protein